LVTASRSSPLASLVQIGVRYFSFSYTVNTNNRDFTCTVKLTKRIR